MGYREISQDDNLGISWLLTLYQLVDRQVNLKYDAWQKELQGGFATILAEETRQVRLLRPILRSGIDAWCV